MSGHPVGNPGSPAAKAAGCTCPVLDNGHGHGPGPFWVRDDCPLHQWFLEPEPPPATGLDSGGSP